MSTQQGDDDGAELYVERPGGFEQIPHELFMDPDVPDSAVRMWLVLSKFGGRDDLRRFPGRKALGAAIGKSVRSVDERLQHLVTRGWLLIQPRFRQGAPGQTSNIYRLFWTPLREENDPRAIAHRKAVAAFEAEMEARRATNGAKRATPSQKAARGGEAGDPLAESCTGGVAESCEAPSQEAATQDSHPSTSHPQVEELSGDVRFAHIPAADEEDVVDAEIVDDEQGTLIDFPGAGSGSKAKSAATGRASRAKVERSPEEQERFEKATEVVEWWFGRQTKKPIQLGRANPFIVCRKLVEGALEAGYSQQQVAKALQATGVHVPAFAVLQTKLAEVDGAVRSGPVGRQEADRLAKHEMLQRMRERAAQKDAEEAAQQRAVGR